MINKSKNILKRKYVTPSIAVEAMEPWEMIAGTGGDVNTTPSGSDGDNSGFAKYNPFFSPYSLDDDYKEEE